MTLCTNTGAVSNAWLNKTKFLIPKPPLWRGSNTHLQLSRWYLYSSLSPTPHKKSLCSFSIQQAPSREWQLGISLGGWIRCFLLASLGLPWRGTFFSNPTCQLLRSIFPSIEFHTTISLKADPRGKQRYDIGSLKTLQPKVPTNTSTFDRSPTSTSSNFHKFILRPKIAWNHTNTPFKYQICSKSAQQNISISSPKRRWETLITLSAEHPTMNPDW